MNTLLRFNLNADTHRSVSPTIAKMSISTGTIMTPAEANSIPHREAIAMKPIVPEIQTSIAFINESVVTNLTNKSLRRRTAIVKYQ